MAEQTTLMILYTLLGFGLGCLVIYLIYKGGIYILKEVGPAILKTTVFIGLIAVICMIVWPEYFQEVYEFFRNEDNSDEEFYVPPFKL